MPLWRVESAGEERGSHLSPRVAGTGRARLPRGVLGWGALKGAYDPDGVDSCSIIRRRGAEMRG